MDDEVRLVVLEDKDGRGDKCSPDLTVDFDGIPDEGDNCPLVYNPYQEDTWGTSEGDVCETGSGISEIYPPNIPVAKIISISKEKDQPFQRVVVEILGSMFNLDFVFVIL